MTDYAKQARFAKRTRMRRDAFDLVQAAKQAPENEAQKAASAR